MRFWGLESGGGLELYLPQVAIYPQINASGISVAHVVGVFGSAFGKAGPAFRLIKNGGLCSAEIADWPDLLFWNWIPIFSAPAREFLLSFGGAAKDFLPCTLESGNSTVAYMHLPQDEFDVVDFDKSMFGFQIAMPQPLAPLPHRIERLVLRSDVNATNLPRFFRVSNRHGQTFSELVVQEDLKRDWQARRLYGAKFRQLN